MDGARKRDEQPQAKLFPFIIAWTLACFLASWVFSSSEIRMSLLGSNLLYFATLSTLQYFVIYRFLHLEVRGWIPLSLAGAIAGSFIIEAIPLDTTFDLIPNFYPAVGYLLAFGLPPIFVWLALRRRFLYHNLWLMAAIVMGPVGMIALHIEGRGGIFVRILDIFGPISLDSFYLLSFAYVVDFALPSIVLGLILYVVVRRGGKADALNHAVE